MAIAKVWYKKIIRKTATLSEVPEKWRNLVLSLLDEALQRNEITQEEYDEYTK